MKKRSRYQDVKSAGSSNIIPFKIDEHWSTRHKRRLESNLKYKEKLQIWCDKNRFSLEVKNEGHHWLFTKEGVKIEWWPSSAKVIFNQVWAEGIHCHDYEQLIKVIKKLFDKNKLLIEKSRNKKHSLQGFRDTESEKLQNWCDNNNFSLEIKNKGIHWILKKEQTRVDWWPSTRKLVINKDYKDTFFAQDINQVIELIENNKKNKPVLEL